MKLGKNISFSFKDGFSVEMAKAPRREKLITQIVERQMFRFNNNIGRWRDAQSQAENLLTPSRKELIRVYNEVNLDAHLTALVQSRILKVIGHKFEIVDSNGDIDDKATEMMNKAWFIKFMEFIMDSRFWGYNLIQFDDLEDFEFGFIKDFPKQHVEPRNERLRIEDSMLDGIPFTEEPFNNWTFYIGDADDLGLYNKAAPHTIWKKDAVGSWADFAIMFGVPPRIGKTNVREESNRKRMYSALEGMGKAFFAVIDKEDEIQIVESQSRDSYKVFDFLIERCNSELSKLILGQTMTVDSGSSLSQSEVHERTLESIIKADCIWISSIINNKFFPWLIEKHNFPLKDRIFRFDMTDQLSLSEQMGMTNDLLPYYKIPEDWIQSKFGIPVEEKAEPIAEKVIEPNKIDNTFISLSTEIETFFGNVPNKFPQNASHEPVLTEEEENELYLGIYAGIITINNLPTNLYTSTAEKINKGVVAGFGGGLDDFSNDPDKLNLLKGLKTDVYEFSAAKTAKQVEQMTSFLKDKKGNIVSFAEFKEKASEVFDTFNENWLRTEFNTAIAQGQSADDWVRIQNQKSVLPLLIYTTVGDNRVRVEHEELDGIIRKVDDTFWALNFPPNGWNCRCYTEQTDDGAITPTNESVRVSNLIVEETPQVFRMNAGKDKIVFRKNHPYFKVEKKNQALKDNNFGLIIPKI